MPQNIRAFEMETNDENQDNLVQELYVLMQPTRQKIVRLLKETMEPLYIEQIAEKVREDRRIVSFHLATLAESGFVEGDYRTIKEPTKNPGRGKGAKFYVLTTKANAALEKLNKILK